MDQNRYTKTFPIPWEQLHRDAKALAWRLLEKGPFKGIVAVTRGGLVPAAIVARELDLRLVDTICVASYEGRDQGEASVLKAPCLQDAPAGEGMLIIEDLTDTGKTARIVRRAMPKALFATVYAKPEGRPNVDLYVTEVSQDTWILFPWDMEGQFVQPIAMVR